MALECEDQELLEGFLTEAAELLEKLDDDLVTLEKNPADMELLNRIFRSIHTVKGASSFLGFDLLVKVTHKTEDVLNRLRKGELVVTPEIMDVVLEAVDLVKVLVNDIKNGEIVERATEGTIAKLMPLQAEGAAPAAPPAATMEQSSDSAQPQKKSRGSGGRKKKEAPSPPAMADGGGVEMIPPPSALVEPAVKGAEAGASHLQSVPKAPAGEARTEDFGDKSTVRVDVKRLDDLMNQVGELVLERNRMIQLNSDFLREGDRLLFGEEFSKLTKRVNFVTSEVQMQVLKMRMLPVGNIFKKFPRIVRNLARELGKEVDLQIIGEETELDRSVVDELGDPLIHLIRNSMDHGLESPAEREAAGKARTGTLVMSATHEGNQIIISIKDDGRGIDPEKVGRKALDKGLVTQEQLAAMGSREIIDLIFLPGFSTKEKATDLSGRGVGMDVVRTNIKKLNGIIDIKSESGQGSEFILKLPLTLAIIQALLVEVENEIYALPLASVLETVRVEGSEFHMVGGQEVFKRKDSVLPLMRLQRVFNVNIAERTDEACYVVVVGAAEKRLGLVVSGLLGQQEVAIKSLGKYLANIPGVGGSTILGDGRVTLIVDPVGLIERNEGGVSRMAA